MSNSSVQEILGRGPRQKRLETVNFPEVPTDHVCPHYQVLARIAKVLFGIEEEVFRVMPNFCGGYFEGSSDPNFTPFRQDTVCIRLNEQIRCLDMMLKGATSNKALKFDTKGRVTGFELNIALTEYSIHTDEAKQQIEQLEKIARLINVIMKQNPQLQNIAEAHGLVKLEQEHLQELLFDKGESSSIHPEISRKKCSLSPYL